MSAAVRAANAADLDGILAIALQCAEAPEWHPSDYAVFLTGNAEPPLLRIGLVATVAAGIQGFAMAGLLLDGIENRCELESIAVDPAVRRHGLGSALLARVIAWAADQGGRRITLEVRASNAQALRLYELSGFNIEGRRPRYYADPEEDALLLGREVTEVPFRDPFSTAGAIEGRPPRC